MIGEKRSVKEYRQLDRLSASDLRLFTLDRRKFFRIVVMKEQEKEKEEYSKSLLIGDIVHTLLLTPNEFDNKFLMSICPAPPTGLMLAFTEALYKHTMLSSDEEGNVGREFEEIAKDAHAESGFKQTLEVVLKKFKDSNAELYYDELRKAKAVKKTVVCVEDRGMAEKIVERVKTHPHTRDAFEGVSREPERYIVYNELQIDDFEVDELPMKAMLDRVIIDRDRETITIYDPKVVWEVDRFYREYYLKRRADIQGYIYFKALFNYNFGDFTEDYVINFPIFVACDSANFYAPINYQMTADDIDRAYDGFEEGGRKYEGVKDIIANIKWCQESGDWTTTKDINANNGFSYLK